MTWLIGKLLFGWGKAVEALSALLSFIRTYPLQTALIASLCLSGWLWAGKNKAIEQRDAARAEMVVQIDTYREAYRRTLAAHWAAKKSEDARLGALKEKADAVTVERREAALAAAARHASAARVQCEARADSGSSGGGGVSVASAASRGAETAASPAELVAITRADLDACTLNTADLATAVEWAKGVAGEHQNLN